MNTTTTTTRALPGRAARCGRRRGRRVMRFDAVNHTRQWARRQADEARAEARAFLRDARALRAAGADPARVAMAACMARLLHRQAIAFRQVAGMLARAGR